MKLVSQHLDKGSLQFPWPRPGEAISPAMRLVVRDPVWIAAVRGQVAKWRSSRSRSLAVIQCDRFAQLTGESISVVEVTNDDLLAIGEWLQEGWGRKLPVVAALSRAAFATPSDRAAATAMLCEAGAKMVLDSPRNGDDLAPLLDGLLLRDPGEADPLDDLPLPCWGPAWQRGSRCIGLSS